MVFVAAIQYGAAGLTDPAEGSTTMTAQPFRSRLAATLPSVLAALALSLPAGAVTTPTVDPTRMPDTSAAVAAALAEKSSGQRTPAERAAMGGFEALFAGDVPRAEAAFQQALQADPRLAAGLVGLADVRLRQKRPADAEALLKRAVANEPKNAALQTSLGRFYFGQGRLAEAKASYDGAIRLDPKALSAHVDLADLYATAERNPGAAIGEYRKALAIKPDYHPARLGLALALLANGDRPGALKELHQLASDTPTDPTAWHIIGRIHASEKRYGEAAKALTEALRVQSDFLPALMDRADVYAAAGEDRKAAVDYEQVLKRRPDDAVSRVKLGMIYQRLGETGKAEASYRAALRTNPELPPAANNLAMIELGKGRNLDEALALSRKAVALAPEVPQFHDTLGQVLRARGDRSGAIAATEKATTLEPPQAEIWYHLGRLYEEAGRKDPAVKAYRRALGIDPKFQDAAAARSRLQALGAK